MYGRHEEFAWFGIVRPAGIGSQQQNDSAVLKPESCSVSSLFFVNAVSLASNIKKDEGLFVWELL